jgi:hypothetical protein
METAETLIRLCDLPVGARLMYRAKSEWRVAVVARFNEQTATISVSSPGGRNYRVSRAADSVIEFDGRVPVLKIETADKWRENLTRYDARW